MTADNLMNLDTVDLRSIGLAETRDQSARIYTNDLSTPEDCMPNALRDKRHASKDHNSTDLQLLRLGHPIAGTQDQKWRPTVLT